MSKSNPKPFDDPFEGSTRFKKSVTLLVILTFISTFFGFDYSLTSVSIHLSSVDISDDDRNYWEDWKIVIIVYYLSLNILTLIGFAGLVYDKTSLLSVFSIFLFLFFIFGLVNEALRKNLFGAIVELPTDLITIAYIYRLRTGTRGPVRRAVSVWTTNEQHMREDVI